MEEPKGFDCKMKECPFCGNNENFPTFPDKETNHFILGVKGLKWEEFINIKNLNDISAVTCMPVMPFTCSKCGYTVLLNKTWA